MTRQKMTRYKNVDHQMVYDDILLAAQRLDVKKTVYLESCGLDSSFHAHLIADGSRRRHPTDRLLKRLARDLKKVNGRKFDDYFIKEPKQEPEQLSLVIESPKPENDPLVRLFDTIFDRLDSIEHKLTTNRADNTPQDSFKDLLVTSGEITPRHGADDVRFNLKISSEAMAYLAEEAHRLRISKTEFINRMIFVYAKKYPHK